MLIGAVGKLTGGLTGINASKPIDPGFLPGR